MRKISKDSIEDILALTPMQEGILFFYQKETDRELYFEQMRLEVSGDLEMQPFFKAWDYLVKNNPALRTVFRWEKLENPIQIILKHTEFLPGFHDFSEFDEQESQELLKNLLLKDREEGFSLSSEPAFRVTLIKLSPGKSEIIISNHHILYDGWSNGILLRDFFDTYGIIAKGLKPSLRHKSPFKEYVRFCQSRDLEKERTFWHDYLQGVDPSQGLSVKLVGNNGKSEVVRIKRTLPPQSLRKIESTAKALKVTPASLVYGAWGLLLQKYNGNREEVFGTTVSGRSVPLPGIEEQVGLFINTLPLKAVRKGGESISSYLKRLHEAVLEREPFEVTPLVNINEYTGISQGQELFDTLVVVENYPLDNSLREKDGPLWVSNYSILETTNYDLTLSVILEPELPLEFIYNRLAFQSGIIDDLSNHFVNILMDLTAHPEKTLAQIDLLSLEEKERLLSDLHNPKEYPIDKTIPGLFQEQVQKNPDALALVGDAHFSYRELDRIANILASRLRALGMGDNRLVALNSRRGTEMIIGILAILKVGSGYVPLNPTAPSDRNDYIMKECAVQLLLTTRELFEADREKSEFETSLKVEFIENFRAEENPDHIEMQDFNSSILSSQIAYVIFTSGSTGLPKGVVITHAQFSPLMHWGYKHMGIGSGDRIVQNLSYYFDWSVWEIFITLTSGAALFTVSREMLLDAFRYSQFMNREQITVLHITPTQFLSLVDCGGNLTTLKHLAIGAEKLTSQLVERTLSGVTPDCRIYNMYGPTEATIMAAVLEIDRSKLPEYRNLSSVPMGGAISNLDLWILDEDLHILPPFVPGELFIGGHGVSPGYINNPELTAERFISVETQNLASQENNKYYRTGDRVRLLADGTIEFLGRVDFQVKIRGFRIEPGEIEAQLLKHSRIKETVVIAREDQSGEKFLCAYFLDSTSPLTVESQNLASSDLSTGQPIEVELRNFLSQNLPHYMIPAFFIEMESLPLNPNGKVDLKALPEPDITASGRKYTAPRDEIEARLAKIWGDLLEVEEIQIGIDDNFFELGGHSLKATRMLSQVQKKFNVDLELKDIFSKPSIRGMAQCIGGRGTAGFVALKPLEKKEYYPVSAGQKRIFILEQLKSENTSYNLSAALLLEGQPDLRKFEETFRALISRHESLRTSFLLVGEKPVQRVHDPDYLDFEMEYKDLSQEEMVLEEQEKRIAEFTRPFQLDALPLLRAGLIKTGPQEHVFLLDMHHIITDGMSMDVFVQEFINLYQGLKLPQLLIQYKEFARWQLEQQEKSQFASQESFWLEQLSGEIPVLDLPCDYQRPSIQSFQGETYRFKIGSQETEALKKRAQITGSTLFMVLSGLVNILFARLSGQEDIILGTPIAGRRHADLQNMIGMFVNTLVLRNYPRGDLPVEDFLKDVSNRTIAAFDNQDYQFEELVEKIDINRDASRNPIFDVLFSLQNMDIAEMEIPGLKLSPYEFENKASKFDLALTGNERDLQIEFKWQYARDLFSQSTIERYANYFLNIVSTVISEPQIKIQDIDFLPPREKQQLLIDFNQSDSPFPRGMTLDGLFAKQVDKSPHSQAIVASSPVHGQFGDVQLTYRELDKQVRRLSMELTGKGVSSGHMVALMMERSLEMVAAMFAVLRIGGAYLPISPDSPRERVEFMLADSGSELLVGHGFSLQSKSWLTHCSPVLYLEDLGEPAWDSQQDVEILASNLAYVIYTSGTTGRPKGVLVDQQSAVNVVAWSARNYGVVPGKKVINLSDINFDASVNQIFGTLCFGAQLHVIDAGLLSDLEKLRLYINRHQINFMHFVPMFLKELLCREGKLTSLDMVISGADRLDDAAKNLIIDKGYRLYNQYGPTETTVDALAGECAIGEDVNLGTPIANVRCYILDRHQKPVPLGVTGELYVGGCGVSRGYLNQPDLTAERFISVETQNLASPVQNLASPGQNFASPDGINRLYRTGDLCKWLPDGKVAFLGRFDFQVKIRGFRIELAETENRMKKHPLVKDAVVTGFRDQGGEYYLCAYIVKQENRTINQEQGELKIAQLKDFLSQTLPDYMVPLHYMFLDEIPLTSNGKVNLKALLKPDVLADTPFIAPRNQRETKLSYLWSRVLWGQDNSNERSIGIDDDFFELGGHSLKATVLISMIHKELEVQIPLAEIFKKSTIRSMGEYIEQSNVSRFFHIQPQEKKEYYLLSSAQKRLYVLSRMRKQSINYNLPHVVVIEGQLDKTQLEKAFRSLISRHPSLRTQFIIVNEEPVQRITGSMDFALEYREALGLDPAPQIARFIRPFDLRGAPLLRVGLIKTGEKTYILILDMHHIVSDGVSLGVLTREFLPLYQGMSLPPLKVQYTDYAHWQQSGETQTTIVSQEEYWLETFSGEIPILELPYDFPRPPEPNFVGAKRVFKITKDEMTRFQTLLRGPRVTLFMGMLSIFNILLAKLSGREDIVIGTPTAGRRHADLEGIIGMFVNTLALRNYPSLCISYLEFIEGLKARTINAFENQDFQFEELVEKVDVVRDMSRNPLFDVLFVLQNMDLQEVEIPGLRLRNYNHENTTSKFDLNLNCTQTGEELICNLQYSTALFKPETIDRFIRYFKNILREVLDDPGKKIGDVEWLPEQEKQEILSSFNDSTMTFPVDKSLDDLFRDQVEKRGDCVAIRGPGFCRNGKTNIEYTLTYGGLDQLVSRFSTMLLDAGVRPGDIVALMMERSLEMVAAMFAVSRTGAAYLPVSSQYPGERTGYMISDSSAAVLITDRSVFQSVNGLDIDIEVIFKEDVYDIVDTKVPEIPKDKEGQESNLAYVIYTSGTTGRPKGVLVNQQSAVNVVSWSARTYQAGPGKKVLNLSDITFDASVNQIFGTLCFGAELHVIDPALLANIGKLRSYIDKHQINLMHFVPMFLKELLFWEGKLNSLDMVIAGADRLADAVKDMILGKGYRLYNQYGPTETTVDALAGECNAGEGVNLGIPVANAHCYILDRSQKTVPLGVIGELYVGGVGVTRGYLNNPELTTERFISVETQNLASPGQNLASPGQNPVSPDGINRLYRTGDLCRWLPGGKVDFLGRADFQVKIRGFRIEPGEIESLLISHEMIKDAVVTAFPDQGGDNALCAYLVSTEPVQPAEIQSFLSLSIPAYMVPLHYIFLDEIPLTRNGKIDRNALPKLDWVDSQREYKAPGNECEEKLAAIWSDVLGIPTPGIEDNFFHLGGHSLKVTIMAARIHKELKVEIPLAEIFKHPTIAGLRAILETLSESTFIPFEKTDERKDFYSLSSAQKRLFVLYCLNPGGTGYNTPSVMRMEGKIDRERLQETFCKIIQRHEILRTSFYLKEGQPVQSIYAFDNIDFKMDYLFLNGAESEKDIIQDFIRPFDLAAPPLLRVGFIREEEERHILLFDMHHIVTDGASMGIFIREFMSIYDGIELPPLRIQYKNYVQWQATEEERGKALSQKKYWLNRFAGDFQVLNLPLDFKRPIRRGYAGVNLAVLLSEQETEKLNRLARAEGATLFMCLIAQFNILLSKLSGQEDILVGTPTAGRRHADTESLIGMFVNTLVLRNFPVGEMTFKEFLSHVKTDTIDAFENQDYPFEDLVDQLNITRDNSRNPLFDVMLSLQNMEVGKIEIPGLTISPYEEYEVITSKFDLSIAASEDRGRLCLAWQYSSELFLEDTVPWYMKYFLNLVHGLLDNPDIKLKDVELLKEEEKKRLLIDFNSNRSDYSLETLQELFAGNSALRPDTVALVGPDKPGAVCTSLTYGALDEQVRLLKNTLVLNGVVPGELVAIGLKEDSFQLIMGILSVIQAGAAYLPISPVYPLERIEYMLRDSGSRTLLTNRSLSYEKNQYKNCDKLIFVEEIYDGNDPSNGMQHSSRPETLKAGPSDPAYVIYTSGTTGNPKGIVVDQKNVANVVAWYAQSHGISPGLKVLKMSESTFDASVSQMFSTLIYGGELHIQEKQLLMNIMELRSYMEKMQINLIDFVPLYLKELLMAGKKLSGLNTVVSGSELLHETIKDSILELGYRLFNNYGPTETTVDALAGECFSNEDVNLGTPIANVFCYILDFYENLVPQGVVGELYIGGAGVARGYLNKPELTADRFVSVETQNLASPGQNLASPDGINRLYRTGDLCRWLPGGQVEFLGRADFQVKIRGFRIEPGEIEEQLLTHAHIKDTVVKAWEKPGGDNYLCAYLVVTSPVQPDEIQSFLSRSLPAYMVPLQYVNLDKIPLTANGKIDRKALLEPGQAASHKEYMAPRDPLEKKLAGIWSQVLHVKQIGINHNFFELGGHSLAAIVLTAKIRKMLGVTVPLAGVFENPTFQGFADYLKPLLPEKEDQEVLVPVEKKEYYPMSSAQLRLYILQQGKKDDTRYNMPQILLLKGELDKNKLVHIFEQIVIRHESLRTSLRMEVGRPVQRVHDFHDIDFQVESLKPVNSNNSDDPYREAIRAFVRPFDLSKAPLIRVGLMAQGESEYILMVDLHHSICDGASINVLIQDFLTLYREESLPGLDIHYKDFSLWQQQQKSAGCLNKAETYWLKQFSGPVPSLELPMDFPDPPLRTYAGSFVRFQLDKKDSMALNKIAKDHGVTLFMILLSIYNILLSRLSGSEDVVVGVVNMGRTHAELERMIGMFVNTLAIRQFPHRDKTFKEFQLEVKERVLTAFDHQSYQFEDLVEKIQESEDGNSQPNPIFNVMFVLQNQDVTAFELPGLKIKPLDYKKSDSKFDLTLIAQEDDNSIGLSFEYSTERFTQETVDKFAEYFIEIVQSVLKKPDILLKDIELSLDLVVSKSSMRNELDGDFGF